MQSVDQAVTIITGGGSGIGRGAAHSFAKRGARVIVTDVDAARAETVAGELKTEYGVEALHAKLDVRKAEDYEAVRDLALDTFGRIDIVHNNVGVLAVGNVEEIPLDAWQRIIDINLMSVVRSNLTFVPVLKAQGSGHIVNTASSAGLFPHGFDRMPYTATKHAVVGISEALSLYLRPDGIGVTCFCPAGVMTNIVEQITTFGTPKPPRAPAFGIITAEEAGEIIVNAVLEDRFLAITDSRIADDRRRHGDDLDAYLDACIID